MSLKRILRAGYRQAQDYITLDRIAKAEPLLFANLREIGKIELLLFSP